MDIAGKGADHPLPSGSSEGHPGSETWSPDTLHLPGHQEPSLQTQECWLFFFFSQKHRDGLLSTHVNTAVGKTWGKFWTRAEEAAWGSTG